MTAVFGYQYSMAGEEGLIVGAREYMNSLDESSMAEIKAAILSEEWLADHYEIGEKYIRTRDRRIEYDFVGLRHNLDSIKSRARIKILWVDEAEPVSETAWVKAIPTVREHGSEIWVTWNPESKKSATHRRFRLDPPEDARIVCINWSDNPWFPDVLNQERLRDLRKRPEQYDHIWEGDFAAVVEGAYFARDLTLARQEGRIGVVPRDPHMAIRAYWDIGGTGARADATAIWIVQFVGREIRVLDYYEAVGQPLAAHLEWLRERYGRAECVLPHDGAHNEKIYSASYEGAIREAGFSVRVIPNQGAGAAAKRIEAVRRVFPAVWFNEATTEAGRDALGWYHEKIDDKRNVGLGPAHDWASHGADAFGLMAVDYRPPVTTTASAPERKWVV